MTDPIYQAGLDALTAIHTKGKKVVVLGDMLELGSFSVKEHENIGQIVASSADVFVAIGVRMLKTAEVALAAKARCSRIESFQNGEEAVDVLRKIIEPGDVVFIKGSQFLKTSNRSSYFYRHSVILFS